MHSDSSAACISDASKCTGLTVTCAHSQQDEFMALYSIQHIPDVVLTAELGNQCSAVLFGSNTSQHNLCQPADIHIAGNGTQKVQQCHGTQTTVDRSSVVLQCTCKTAPRSMVCYAVCERLDPSTLSRKSESCTFLKVVGSPWSYTKSQAGLHRQQLQGTACLPVAATSWNLSAACWKMGSALSLAMASSMACVHLSHPRDCRSKCLSGSTPASRQVKHQSCPHRSNILPHPVDCRSKCLRWSARAPQQASALLMHI